MKKITVILSLLVFGCLFTGQPVQAVNFAASLSPAIQHILIKPGKQAKVNFTLHNIGDPVTLQLKLAKVQPENEDYVITEIQESSVKFVNPDVKKPFIMTSNEVKDIEIEVTLPGQLTQADYYFAIIAETVPQPGVEGKATIQLQGSVTSLLLLSVKDNADLDFSPKIAIFDTKPRFRLSIFGKKYEIFDTSDPIPVILTVQNQGENAFQAEGWITFTDSKQTHTYPLSPKYLLSSLQSTLSSPLSLYCVKKENETTKVCQDSSSIILPPQQTGLYDLKTVVTVGKQGKGVQAEISFIVLPIRLLVIMFTIAACVPFLLLFYIKKKQN